MAKKDLELKWAKARADLIITQPFIATIMLGLEFEEKGAEWFALRGLPPTAGTDGRRLVWCKEYIETLEWKELVGLLAHEVWHVALLHPFRRGDRDPMKWNYAADYTTNEMLESCSITLPKGCLRDSQYNGMSTEAVYNKIPDPPEMPSFGSVFDPTGGEGKNGDSERALSPAEMKQAEQEAKVQIQQAIATAKAQGKIPGGMERWMEEFADPQVPWSEILRRLMITKVKDNFTWKRPNKRYVHQGAYIPSMDGRHVGEVLIFMDTSGSIGQEEIAHFGAETSSILEDVGADATVVYFDSEVAHVETFTRQDLPLKLEAKGGGGTDFVPPFVWAEKEEKTPICIVVFTDMYCDSFPREPDVPVYWVSTTKDMKAPWGTMIEFENVGG